MGPLMKSLKLPLTTHVGWSAPKTQRYFSSTPYLDCCNPINN